MRLENNNDSVTGVLEGIRKAASIITSTMGGSGKNVLFFENKFLQFTKDGVSVAKKIQFKNQEEDAGAQMLITASNKTVNECGDGTTLTSLLTQEFVSRLFKLCETQSINDTLESWQSEIDTVIKELETRTRKIESLDDIYKIAMTSCKNEKLALLIYEIYRKVGLKASISVQLSEHSPQTYYEVTKGLNFDGGSIHGAFANQVNGTYQAEKPVIEIVDDVMSSFEEYADYISTLHENKTPLVIIAKDFSDSFIRAALTNKNARNLDICLLKLPGWGNGVKENIRDLKAFLTNNRANSITVSPTDFTIYNNPEAKKIRTRVKQLEAQMESFTEDWDIKDFQHRVDKLNQTSAIIYVGGRTLSNAQEEFDRIEDAIGACKTACKTGYVRGTGSELVDIADYSKLRFSDEFRNVLLSPARKILANANIQLEPTSTPYNVRTKQLDENLIDPTNVIITAILNSFALATLLINTSYILHD